MDLFSNCEPDKKRLEPSTVDFVPEEVTLVPDENVDNAASSEKRNRPSAHKSRRSLTHFASPDLLVPPTESDTAVKFDHSLYSPDLPTKESSDDESACEESMRELFHKAYAHLNPSAFFRTTIYLFAERKLLVFFWAHFLATMVIWVHFFLIEFEEQMDEVQETASYYWLRLLAPPFEFGSMHAVLFQMALIPLTMSRYSIAAASGSILENFVPLNRMVRIHIYLGYVVISTILVSVAFFLAFFGLLCVEGEAEFCAKFTSEIMITGYVILAMLLIVLGTSYFRHSIPYEVFYVIHHVVFLFYIVTVAHTMDAMQRSGRKQRSQTFQWFSLTILYYVCDRTTMHLNQKFRTRLVACSAVEGTHSRMLILKLHRPSLFRFQPGQYAFVRWSKIDVSWHPFSIASDPASPHLEFYIEVHNDKTWTSELWTRLAKKEVTSSECLVEFEIMGPYGTALASTSDFSHAIAIGTGTGFVPILSLFKQQVCQLKRLSPQAHFDDLKELQERLLHVEVAEEPRKGSLFRLLTSFFCRCRNSYRNIETQSSTDTLRDSIQQTIRMREDHSALSPSELRMNLHEFKAATFTATRSIYGVVLLGVLPVFGVALIGFTISWNTVSATVPTAWLKIVQALTVVFQGVYAFVAIFVWDGSQFLAYTDLVVCIVAPFADWYWCTQYNANSVLDGPQIATYVLLTLYMTARAWSMVIKPRRTSSWGRGVDTDGIRTLERLDVIWVTRSAELVSEILPDVNDVWEALVEQWGEHATSVCRFNLYVTEPDPAARERLIKEVSSTALYKSGLVHFGRPDLGAMIEGHSIEMICTRRSSYSLLAYVGSPEMARDIHECKLFNDIKVSITGNKKHQMEFVSEHYGGVKPKSKAKAIQDGHASDSEGESKGNSTKSSASSTKRRTILFGKLHQPSFRRVTLGVEDLEK